MIEALNPIASGTSPVVPDRAVAGINQSETTGFGDMLTQLATNATQQIEQAEHVSMAKMTGAEIPVREVVDKMMAAQQSLNTMLAVRDKIVQAYTEISHTQI